MPSLEDLRWHWGETYEITRAFGMFRAVRRDGGAATCAPTTGKLLAEIRADLYAQQTPRKDAEGQRS